MSPRLNIANRYGSPRYTSIDQPAAAHMAGGWATPDHSLKADAAWDYGQVDNGGSTGKAAKVVDSNHAVYDKRLSGKPCSPRSNRAVSDWLQSTSDPSRVDRSRKGEVVGQGSTQLYGSNDRWGTAPSIPEGGGTARETSPEVNSASMSDPFDDKHKIQSWPEFTAPVGKHFQDSWSDSRKDSGRGESRIKASSTSTGYPPSATPKSQVDLGRPRKKERPQHSTSRDKELEELRQQLAEEKRKNADLGRRLWTLENEEVDPGTVFGVELSQHKKSSKDNSHGTTVTTAKDSQIIPNPTNWSAELPTHGRRRSGMSRLTEPSKISKQFQTDSEWGNPGYFNKPHSPPHFDRHTGILRDTVRGTRPLFFTMSKKATFGEVLQGWGKRRALQTDGLRILISANDGARVVKLDRTAGEEGVVLKHMELEIHLVETPRGSNEGSWARIGW